MSVLDQIRALERQVQQRLRELRPLVAEYRDLEKVAERLGLRREDDEAAETTTATAKPKPAAGRARKPAAKRRAAKRKPSARAPKRAKPKAASAPQSAAGASKLAARKRRAAAPGEREQDVLRLARERPGVTVAEMAKELDVDATGLYGVVRRLQAKGQITKDGTQLRAADAQPAGGDGSAAPPAPPAPEAPEPPAQQPAEEPPARES
jgi:hypothetical protein